MSDSGGRTPPRRFAAALAAVPLLALLITDGALLARHADRVTPARPPSHPAPTVATAGAPGPGKATSRTLAIRDLLARRSAAVLHHDRSAWAATIDPAQRRFRARQLRVFDNLQRVPFASWSYEFDPAVAQPSERLTARYGVESWAPVDFALHYRLRGFDKQPTDLTQYPTFVHRGRAWLLASLSDFAGEGMRSSLDLWDFGPVTTLRKPTVLVLGHPSSSSLMSSLAAEVAADIPRVNNVWGTDWAQRAVVLVPDTQRELGRVVDDSGQLDHIAAVATAEVNIGSGQPNPVGDRIGINPANWPKLSPLGRRIVLTHELTHVATRSVTSAATPSWLAEGFADYIGYLGSGVPTPFVAQDLGSDIRAGRVPRSLPADTQFNGANGKLSQAYEGSWMACQLMAQTYGQRALVRFYRDVGSSHQSSAVALASAYGRVFHVSARDFVARWRAYLRSALA